MGADGFRGRPPTGVQLASTGIDSETLFRLRLETARATARATTGFSDAHPHLTARFRLSPGQRLGASALVGAGLTFAVSSPEALSLALMAIASMVFTIIIVLRTASAISAAIDRRATFAATAQQASALPTGSLPVLTVLAPLYREGRVVRNLVEALIRLDYPTDLMEVKLLVEGDDEETLEALSDIRLPPHIEILPVPPCAPRTKPKALNFGLEFTRGDIVVVFDAEDIPSPGQPREAMAAFMRAGERLAVVQAPLSAHNGGSSWIAGQFALEYAVHFTVWLPFLTRLGWPMLLGGTSNYIRRSWLQLVGGWDPWNVTEDADLGIRLARAGATAEMISLPTMEEAPVRLVDWLGQRTRWLKGHLQTWLVVMRSPLWAMRDLGIGGFLGLQMILAGSLMASLLHGPIVAWLLLSPLMAGGGVAPPHLILLGSGYGSVVAAVLTAGRHTATKTAMLWLPLYWPLQSIAMIRAIWEFGVRPHSWSKTPHGISPARPDA